MALLVNDSVFQIHAGTGVAAVSQLIIIAAGFKLVEKLVTQDALHALYSSGQVPKLTVRDAEGKEVIEIVQVLQQSPMQTILLSNYT